MKRYIEIKKEDIITQCILCGRIQNKDGTWNKKKGKIIRKEPYSHGYCPECFKKEKDRIKKL